MSSFSRALKAGRHEEALSALLEAGLSEEQALAFIDASVASVARGSTR